MPTDGISLPEHFQNQLAADLEVLSQADTASKRQGAYTKLLQLMVEATNLTSAYLCQWYPKSKQSKIVAEYFSEDANYFERQSDLGKLYEENPKSVIGRWISNEDIPDKQIVFYDLPPDNPDRITYLTFGARSIQFIRILVGNQTWGYLELWESRYNHTFNLNQQALYRYIAGELANHFANLV